MHIHFFPLKFLVLNLFFVRVGSADGANHSTTTEVQMQAHLAGVDVHAPAEGLVDNARGALLRPVEGQVQAVEEPGEEVDGVPLLRDLEALLAAQHHRLQHLVRAHVCLGRECASDAATVFFFCVSPNVPQSIPSDSSVSTGIQRSIPLGPTKYPQEFPRVSSFDS